MSLFPFIIPDESKLLDLQDKVRVQQWSKRSSSYESGIFTLMKGKRQQQQKKILIEAGGEGDKEAGPN